MAVTYNNIISLENLYEAWEEFVCGKRYKKDVAEFSLNLSHHITTLHEDLKNKSYRHGSYIAFAINDPKPRNIHKASVRDRLLHHAIHRALYPHIDRRFIYDSYSCRNSKGTHRALNRLRHFAWKVSKSNNRTCWILKCDIRKFFASIDHAILLDILRRYISDQDVLELLGEVVGSFHSTRQGMGLPLGNLTSQLLANVYLNELDQFVKHRLKAKYYIRYADDFVFLSHERLWLEEQIPLIQDFLWQKLKLTMHPDKVFIKTLASGVDFLGWVHFPDHRVLRTATRRRMMWNISIKSEKTETVQSYLGMLQHGNAWKLQCRLPHRTCLLPSLRVW